MEDAMENSDESEKRLGRIMVKRSDIASISLAK